MTARREGGAGVVFRNWAAMAGAEVATRLLSLAVILYLSRTLAPRGVGVVEFGLAAFSFLCLVTVNGVEARLVPAIVARPDDVARLAGRGLVLGWAQLAVALVAFLAVARGIGVPSDMWMAAVVFGGAAALVPAGLGFTFIARERMAPVGIGLVAGSLVFLGLAVGWVRAPDDALRAGACFVVATAVRSAIPLLAFLRSDGLPVARLRGAVRDLVETAGLGVGGLARGLRANVDVLVLGLLAPPEAVAAYALATKLPLFLASMAAMAHVVLFPTIARAVGADDRARAADLERAAQAASLACVLPATVCLGAVAGPIATGLFTATFDAAGPILAVLLWRVPLLAAGGIYRTRLWAESPARDAQASVQTVLVSAALLVGAVSCLGPAAAAWAMVAGDAVGMLLYARGTGDATLGRLRAAGPAAAAIVVAAAAALAFPDGAAGVVAAVVVAAALAVAAGRPPLRRLRRLLDGHG